MDQKALIPTVNINGTQFYKHPFLDIMIATNPAAAIQDLWRIWQSLIRTPEEAATVLAVILDRCRKYSLQTIVYLEYPDYLPEEHRLTSAILALAQKDNVYQTPQVNPSNYSAKKLFSIFGNG